MGGAVGLVDQIDFQVQFHMLFVDDSIREAEILLKKNRYARRCFLEFVEGQTWIHFIHFHEKAIKDLNGPKSIWKKFGYKDPFLAAGSYHAQSISSSAVSVNGSTGRLSTIDDESERTTAPPAAPEPIKKWTLFDDNELRAVLCFILWPLYCRSPEYRALHESLDAPPNQDSFSTAECETEKVSTARPHRLRDLLVDTMSTLDLRFFNRYLADPRRSWIDDFKAALVNLPITLMVSAIQEGDKRSPVAFINNDPQDGFSSKWKQQEPLSWSSAVGRDMHELCADALSPGGARQVETAIFNAKGYKVSITDGKACKLRAVKPIHNREGKYVYAVALETPFFENPAQLEQLGMYEQSEKQFQQMDDLLALLPLLVKV